MASTQQAERDEIPAAAGQPGRQFAELPGQAAGAHEAAHRDRGCRRAVRPVRIELTVPGLTGEPEITLLRAAAAGIRSVPPLSVRRDVERGGHHARAADRLVGRHVQRTGEVAAGAGRPARLHRGGAGVVEAASSGLRVFGPRACRRAVSVARRLPAILRRHRSRVPERPFDGRRCGVGHRAWRTRISGRA